MNKSEIFQFLKTLHNSDIPTMVYRETVFDIISFGKTSKIHLATTASIERVKRVLSQYNPENYTDEKDTIKLIINNDVFFIHSIFKMSYDDFVKKMVPTNLTFNSLLMKPNGQIYDMYGGLEDLKNKKLNFVETFNFDADSNLILNCIRYIYKNNFIPSDDVVSYLQKSVSSLSKSEKTNALFYLVEALNNNTANQNLNIIFDSDFFAPASIIQIDFLKIIEDIGLAQFIYVLLLLLNINVNKSKFSSIINTSEFNEIKEDFNLDLSDEINYYNLKDAKGYDYLSNIIKLQKTVCTLKGKDFVEPVYHKQTVFDMLENTNNSIAINDENFLLSENDNKEIVQLDKKSTFDLFEESSVASATDVDFSSIFEDDKNDEKEISIIDNNNYTTDEKNDEKIIVIKDNNDITEEENIFFDEALSNNEENIIDVSEIKEIPSTSLEEVNISNDTVFNKDSTVNTENSIETEKEDMDDIDSLLSSFHNNESSSLKTKVRSKNPHMENLSIGNINNEVDKSLVEKPEITSENINEAKTVVKEVSDIVLSDTNNGSVDEQLQSPNLLDEEPKDITPPEQPTDVALKIEQQKSQQKRYSTSSVVDSIFEEEVKVKPIEMNSDFADLVSKVADNTKDAILEVRRKTVDENLPEDETIHRIEEIQKLQNEETDVNIDDKDLIAILDELNGKKSNSGFLDDDDSEQQQEDDIIVSSIDDNASHQFFVSKNETPADNQQKQGADDFFQSLSDDFAEIVGGNK